MKKIIYIFILSLLITAALMFWAASCHAQSVAPKWQTTGNYGVGQSAYIGTADSTHLSFGVNGSEKARINNNGMFGIGTANPSQKLTVVGTIYSTTGGFKFPDGTTQTTAATGSGTVSSVSTTNGYGITSSVANPTTTPNITIATDTTKLSTKYYASTQKPNLVGNTGISVSGTSPNNTLKVDTTLISTKYFSTTQKPNLSAGSGISISGTSPNLTITNSSPSSGGTVTSVASGYGILGGSITTTGTLKADTTHLPTGNGLFTQYDFASRTGTIVSQNANNVALTGGTINGTTLGATTPSTGAFTTLSGNTTTSTTPVLSFNGSGTLAAFGSTTANSYNQLIIQNKSATTGASANLIVSNNLATDTSYYAETGMNSSAYSSGTPVDFLSINNGAYFSAHNADLTIGSSSGGRKIYFTWGTGGASSAHVINSFGAIGLNTNITGTTNFGAAGQVLTSQGSSSTPTWTTVSAAPAGSTTQLQVNVSGALGAYSNLTTDGTTLFQSNSFGGTYNNANCAAVFGNTGTSGCIRIGQTGYISSYWTGGQQGLQFMSTSGNFYFFNNGYNGGTSNVILDASGGATGSILSGVKTLSSWNGIFSIDHIAPNGGNYFRIRTENGSTPTPSLTERFTIDVGATTVDANLINANLNIGGASRITPNSTLQITGSVGFSVTQKTGNYTATISDNTIEYTSSTASPATLTLPTAVGINGRIYVVVNASAQIITIATTSSQTFVNASGTPTSLTMSTNGTYVLESDNANWMVISKY